MKRWAVLIALALAGCEVVDIPGAGQPPPTLYVLNAPPPRAAQEGARLTVGVDEPSVAGGLDTPRMLARTGPNALTPIARASWVEPTATLLWRHLVDVLDADPRIRMAGEINRGFDYDVGLYTDLRRFEADATGGGQIARVVLRARLVDLRARRLIGLRSFAAEAPVSGAGAGAVAAGFQAALDQVSGELDDWVVAEGG